LDAPVVTKAFLKYDLATLELHCGPELLERLKGIFAHVTQQGRFDDPTILFVGDVEIVEVWGRARLSLFVDITLTLFLMGRRRAGSNRGSLNSRTTRVDHGSAV
jgi:hypothetical protein